MNGRLLLFSFITVIAWTFCQARWQGPGSSMDCLAEDNSTIPPKCEDYAPETKYIPHPLNCSLFWECGPDHEHCLNECPQAGGGIILYFNPILNVCDWPDNVNCTMKVNSTQDQDSSPRLHRDVHTEVDPDGCLPDDEADPPNCNDFQHTTYIPHPFNCSRYWECQPQNGHCLYECPLLGPGLNLYFNPDLLVCDWPDQVNCTMGGECKDCQSWQTCVAGICTPECKEDVHCEAGEICEGGQCMDGCRSDEDCQGAGEVCNNGTCVTDTGCSADADCGANEWCNGGDCVPGCSDDSACAGCGKCVDHACVDPECCHEQGNSGCNDPSKPICSEDNVCIEGCLRNKHCPGWNATCDATNSNCNYCDQATHTCKPGCHIADNCDGYHCTAQHTCTIGLKDLTLNTYTCVGCQGSQGIKDEDGPFVVLVGANGISCNTRQLDHVNAIDFDNGKTAVFDSLDILQSCYKIDLGAGVVDGSIHWTSLSGVWTPKDGQIQINFSGSPDNSECCCLSKSSLSVSSAVGTLQNCAACKNHPGC